MGQFKTEVTRGTFDPRTYKTVDKDNWARKRKPEWMSTTGQIHFVRERQVPVVTPAKEEEIMPESLAPAPYTTSFTGTTVSGVAKMDVVGGKLQILQQPDVTINVEGLNVQMENLFGGEADGLAKVVLRFVNKESDKFIKDFQPEIAKQVSELIK